MPRQAQEHLRCQISSFYIKPQQTNLTSRMRVVVKYRLSTSNHNPRGTAGGSPYVVKYRLSTSNHNVKSVAVKTCPVVKYRLSTSNHNSSSVIAANLLLSNIVFLHQTTTSTGGHCVRWRCQISSFYIKPQL